MARGKGSSAPALLLSGALLFAAAPFAPPARAQSNFQTLHCEFSSGTSARFDRDWDVRSASDKLSFTFEGIDTQRAKARIVSPFGMSEVLLFKGGNSLNFLEIMPDGNQAFTTVFFTHSRDGKTKGAAPWYPAAHSRHMLIGRTPVVSHYRGYCQPN